MKFKILKENIECLKKDNRVKAGLSVMGIITLTICIVMTVLKFYKIKNKDGIHQERNNKLEENLKQSSKEDNENITSIEKEIEEEIEALIR